MEVAAERLDFEPARRGSEGVSEAPAHVRAPAYRLFEHKKSERHSELGIHEQADLVDF